MISLLLNYFEIINLYLIILNNYVIYNYIFFIYTEHFFLYQIVIIDNKLISLVLLLFTILIISNLKDQLAYLRNT